MCKAALAALFELTVIFLAKTKYSSNFLLLCFWIINFVVNNYSCKIVTH